MTGEDDIVRFDSRRYTHYHGKKVLSTHKGSYTTTYSRGTEWRKRTTHATVKVLGMQKRTKEDYTCYSKGTGKAKKDASLQEKKSHGGMGGVKG